MTANASIAGPYAKAVFDLATESGTQDDWSATLEFLALISQDEDFINTVNTPQVSAEQVEGLLLDVLGKKIPAGGDNFIKLLTQNARTDVLADIQQQFTALLAESRQSIEAEVVTARPLSADQKTKLTDALQTRLGVSVSLVEVVDESLVGGAMVKAGDLVIDGSAKGRVEKLAIALS